MTTLINGSVLTYNITPDTSTPAAASFQVIASGTMTDSNFTNTLDAAVQAACAASSGNYTYSSGTVTVKPGVSTPLEITRTVSSVPAGYAGYALTMKPVSGVRVFKATSGVVHGTPTIPTVPTIRGVNLSGMEFSTGTTTSAGLWPPLADVDFYADRGFNVIRLPFKKARVQNGLFGELDIVGNGTGDAERVKTLVDYITITKGMYCILDPHDGAAFGGVTGRVGSDNFPVAAFEDFWVKLINYLGKDNDKLIFNIENEPAGLTAPDWMRVCNSVTAAIRAQGCTQQIQVPGISFTGAHSWISSGNGAAMLNYTDEINNSVFEVHQYLDPDSSGTTWTCTVGGGSTRLDAFINWCATNSKKGFLGEFGGDPASDAQCGVELPALLDDCNAASQFIGWAAWGGGRYWGNTYPFRTQNADGSANAPVLDVMLSKL
jgi:endoglucanase